MRARRLGAAVAVVLATTLSGCVVLPPALAPALPAPPAVSVQPPAEPTGQPTQPPAPSATPVPTQDASPFGPLFGGNEPESASGLQPDAPTTTVIEPSRGVPVLAEGAPWGDSATAEQLLPDADPATAGNLMLSTTGRLITTFLDGTSTSCTATVVNAATDDVAITAAHCLFNPVTRSEAATMQFIPGDRFAGGRAPYGVWYAETWWVPQIFLDTASDDAGSSNGDGYALDMGFMTFGTANGAPIEAYTGGQGVSFTAETHGAIALGYPSNPPYDGQSLRYCSATSLGFGGAFWPHYTMPCGMTGGMSGGPWITNAAPDTGAGYIVAVSSTIPPGLASGTPLGAAALGILGQAEAS